MADPVDMDDGRRDLAGEYALGVLEGDELAAAQRLMLSDRHFAEQFHWWAHRLAGMAEEAAARAPSDQVWPAIERRLDSPADDRIAPTPARPAFAASAAPRGFSGWQIAGAMAGAAAVATAFTLLVGDPRRGPVESIPAQVESAEARLVAQLQSDDRSISLASMVEQQTGRISINISGLEPGIDRAPELWIVPGDGVPRSMGRIPESGRFSRYLTELERQFLVAGSTLAVTYEDPATIPHTAPTTEIIVSAKLAPI
jgi:anti-sigma-K factor RskA